jgi:hypothetical protein
MATHAPSPQRRSVRTGRTYRGIDGQPVPKGFRQCVDCEQIKPESDFHIKTKWPDGSPRYFHSYCKPCHLARNRVSQGVKDRGRPYRERPPRLPVEEARERKRERERARMENPEYRKRKYDAVQRWQKKNPGKARRIKQKGNREYRRRLKEPWTPALQPSENLSPAPFVRYVRSAFPNLEVAAEVMHMDYSHLRHICEPNRSRVSLIVVDRALVAAGRPDVLNTLYPVGRHHATKQKKRKPKT